MIIPNNVKITWIDLEKELAYVSAEVPIHGHTHAFCYNFHPQYISKEDMVNEVEKRIEQIKQILKKYPEARFSFIDDQNICELIT